MGIHLHYNDLQGIMWDLYIADWDWPPSIFVEGLLAAWSFTCAHHQPRDAPSVASVGSALARLARRQLVRLRHIMLAGGVQCV